MNSWDNDLLDNVENWPQYTLRSWEIT